MLCGCPSSLRVALCVFVCACGMLFYFGNVALMCCPGCGAIIEKNITGGQFVVDGICCQGCG